MDISKIKPSERTIEIHHPSDETFKMGIRVSIMSINDERMKKIKRKIQDEKTRRELRGKSFKAEEIEDNQTALLFEAMTGWQWYNPTGKPGEKEFDEDRQPSLGENTNPEFNRKNVIEALSSAPWMAEQIAAEVSEEKAFFTNSKPN